MENHFKNKEDAIREIWDPVKLEEFVTQASTGRSLFPEAHESDPSEHETLTPEITGHQALLTFTPPIFREPLAAALEESAVAVQFAEGTGEALSAIEARRPTLLVLSVEARPLHGFSLLSAIRACPYYRALPIIVVSTQDPKHLDFSYHRPDFILGPDADIRKEVRKFINDLRTPKRDRLPGESPWVHLNQRILISQSSIITHRLVARPLHVAGAEVTIAENTSEFMLADFNVDHDLVIIDLDARDAFPEALIRFVRTADRQAPIIGLLTPEDGCLPRGEEVGVTAVLPKPVRRRDLFPLCERVLSKVNRDRVA